MQTKKQDKTFEDFYNRLKRGARAQFQKDWFIGRTMCFLGAWMALVVKWTQTPCATGWAVGSFLTLGLCLGLMSLFLIDEVKKVDAGEIQEFRPFLDIWVENTFWMGGLTLFTFCVIRLTGLVS